MNWLSQRIRSYFFAPSSPTNLAVCRILFFGTLLIQYFPKDFAWYGEVPAIFWKPVWLLEVLHLPQADATTISVLQIVWKFALLLSAIGLATRLASFASLALGGYLLAVTHSFGGVCHYDAIYVLLMSIMTVSRCGDALSVDAFLKDRHANSSVMSHRSLEYTWPIRLAWLCIAMAYFSAGFAKLRVSGFHWFASDFMQHQLILHQYYGGPATSWGPQLARIPLVCNLLALSGLAIEVFYPLALISRRARGLLVPGAYLLHVGIYLLMGPRFLTWIVLCVFWVPWEVVICWIARSTQYGQADCENQRLDHLVKAGTVEAIVDPSALDRSAWKCHPHQQLGYDAAVNVGEPEDTDGSSESLQLDCESQQLQDALAQSLTRPA